jgi:hypothetical protein
LENGHFRPCFWFVGGLLIPRLRDRYWGAVGEPKLLVAARGADGIYNEPPHAGCHVVSIWRAMRLVADAIYFALAVAILNCFSFLHAAILARGVGHPLSYPRLACKIYSFRFQRVTDEKVLATHFYERQRKEKRRKFQSSWSKICENRSRQ